MSWNISPKNRTVISRVTLHVSVWVEIENRPTKSRNGVGHAPRERVSWNYIAEASRAKVFSHAPRERVSWNEINLAHTRSLQVTLHVSVWVEIYKIIFRNFKSIVTLHVSVWVEIICDFFWCIHKIVTLHVSVWVEIFVIGKGFLLFGSRSTWACELKLLYL